MLQDQQGPTGPTGATGASGAAPILNFVNATNDASQSPAAGAALTFATNSSEAGTAVTHTGRFLDFTLTENGTYEIRYSCYPGAGATPPVTAQVSLQQDGTPIAGNDIETIQ